MAWRDKARSNQERRAETFRFNPEMEHIAKIKTEQPDKFDKLPATTKTAYGFYQSAKEAAKAEGIDVSAPAGV